MTDERKTVSLAEQSVIGAILLDEQCIGDVLLHVSPDDFPHASMRALFEAAKALYLARKPVDVVTVPSMAGGGDLNRLALECMEITPTSANVLEYCRILREQAQLSRVRAAAEHLLMVDSLEEARDILAQAQTALSGLPGLRSYTIAEMMANFLRRLGEPRPEYVHWGIRLLDRNLRTRRGHYVIIAARPSTGKTALALQLGLNISQTKRVGFFSLETDEPTADERIGAANFSLTLPDILDRRVTPSDMTAVASQMAECKTVQGDFEFLPVSHMTVSDIRTVALAKRFDVVIIDYVQMLTPSIRGERTQQLQQISMELRAMTQLTGVIVIALAQTKRPDSQQHEKAPTMAELKESGQLEQDANTILMLYHVDSKNRNSDRWLKIEKDKEGCAGARARFRFDGEKQKFTLVKPDGTEIKDKYAKFEDIDEQMSMEDLPKQWK